GPRTQSHLLRGKNLAELPVCPANVDAASCIWRRRTAAGGIAGAMTAFRTGPLAAGGTAGTGIRCVVNHSQAAILLLPRSYAEIYVEFIFRIIGHCLKSSGWRAYRSLTNTPPRTNPHRKGWPRLHALQPIIIVQPHGDKMRPTRD